jgi:nucleoside-diphosphate-sugar epimerase
VTDRLHVLVTGGCGFVLAATARDLLRALPSARVTVVDRSAPSSLVREFFSAEAERVAFAQADVCDRDSLPDIDATHVVHGATVTFDPYCEGETPREYVDVNVGGTVNMLEWARRRPVRRFVYVSSGSVYGSATRWSPQGAQDEDGPFEPTELYALTKYAAERIALRYGEIFPLDVRSVRLSAVFGPMERPTPARSSMSLVYRAMRACVEGRPLVLTPRSLAAGVDLVSSEDVGAAIRQVLVAERLTHAAFNVAGGRLTPVGDLLAELAEVVPGMSWTTDGDRFDADLDPAQVRARFAAYSTDRIAAEAGWRPRPLGDQLRAYADWVAQDPDERCPAYARPAPAAAAARVG